MSSVIQIARKALKTKAAATNRPNLQITISSDGQQVVTIPFTSSPTITDVTDVNMTDASMTTEGATAGTVPDRRSELPLTPPVSITPAGTTTSTTEWNGTMNLERFLTVAMKRSGHNAMTTPLADVILLGMFDKHPSNTTNPWGMSMTESRAVPFMYTYMSCFASLSDQRW